MGRAPPSGGEGRRGWGRWGKGGWGDRSPLSGGCTREAQEPPQTQSELGHQALRHKGGMAIWGAPTQGRTGRTEASGSHLVELSPSMADSISSSYESSSDRPLGDELLNQKPEPCHPRPSPTCPKAVVDAKWLPSPGAQMPEGGPGAACRVAEGQVGPTEAQRGQMDTRHQAVGPAGWQPSREQRAALKGLLPSTHRLPHTHHHPRHGGDSAGAP